MSEQEKNKAAHSHLSALILAGKRLGEDDPVAAFTAMPLKALAPVGDRPMIAHVIEALLHSGRITQIFIALPQDLDVARHSPALTDYLAREDIIRIDAGTSPSGSVMQALQNDQVKTPRLLITTADHPLLEGQMIRDFCDNWQAPVGVGMVALDSVQKAFPGIRRTRLRFRDGGYKGCNLFGLDRADPNTASLLDFWKRLESLRKKPLAMAKAVGPLTAVFYILRLVSLKGMFKRISRKTGIEIEPVLLDHPRAALDVDRVSDLELVREIREQSGSGRTG